MKQSSSPLLLVLAGVLSLSLLLGVAAAPSPPNNSHGQDKGLDNVHDVVQRVWSAIELWIYRLLHGGQNPPGYGASSSASSSSASSTRVSSSATSSTVISSATSFTSSAAVPTTSSAASSTVIVSSSASSLAVASSTSVSSSSTASAVPSGSVSPLGESVCAVREPSFYAPSCSITSDDKCCYTEQGHFLETFFWDTGASSTGPNDSWTVHGLWPDRCDGSYDSYCQPSMELTNITAVLQSAGQTDLLAYMDVFWKDYSGDDETFWEHEYNKHATCISSLYQECFTNYYPQAEAVTFFNKAVSLAKTLPSYDWLAEAGIVPSLTATYTLEEISAVLEAKHGGGVNVNCAKGGVLDELWFHFAGRGSIIDGDFIPVAAVGSGSTCPTTGIKYYPKFVSIPGSTTTASGSTPTASGSSGKGFIYAVEADGTIPSGTCVISGGTWYKGGTCAGFTLGEITGGAVTLTSSKGLCAVDATTGVLGCSASVTQGAEFVMADDGTLNLGGSTAFSAGTYPAGSAQVPISKGSAGAIPLTLKYVAQ